LNAGRPARGPVTILTEIPWRLILRFIIFFWKQVKKSHLPEYVN